MIRIASQPHLHLPFFNIDVTSNHHLSDANLIHYHPTSTEFGYTKCFKVFEMEEVTEHRDDDAIIKSR